MATEPLLCGTAVCSVLPWPQAFSDGHDRISHSTNRAVMRRKTCCQLLSTCVLPPVFPVYVPKELYNRLLFDNTTMIQTPRQPLCAFQMCMTDRQSVESWTSAMQCNLPIRILSHFKGDYDRQNNKAAGNGATAITHFHLDFEGQRF